MKIRILDSSGNELFSNLDPKYLAFFSGKLDEKGKVFWHGEQIRYGRYENTNGVVEAVTTEPDLLSNEKMFEMRFRAAQDFLSYIGGIRQKIIDDLLHNITRIHGHNTQEIYGLIPEPLLEKPYDKQTTEIKDLIWRDLQGTARVFVQVIRNNRLMAAEFNNVRLLHGAALEPKFKLKQIHPIVQSVAYLYDQALNPKRIFIRNTECRAVVNIDDNLFRSALIPIFENFTKYVKDHSEVVIKYESKGSTLVISFHMTSLAEEEMEEIFKKGFSGTLSKKMKKNGKGLGMYQAKRLIELNKGTIRMVREPDSKAENDYSQNILEITLRK